MQNYCLTYKWAPDDLSFAFYTEEGLKRMHRNLGHPKVKTTINLLKRGGTDPIPSPTLQMIEAIAADCMVCKITHTVPKRFTVGFEDAHFTTTSNPKRRS